MFELSQVFAESCGHQSLCSIHVIKPTHPNFDHTKYEPDISNLARKKWGVKIEVDCRTPCNFAVCERDEGIHEGRRGHAAGRPGGGEAVPGGDHPQDHEGDRNIGQIQEALNYYRISFNYLQGDPSG